MPSTTPKAAPPIVAILRGVKHDEILDIAAALVEAGIEAIEVPLNSPDPLVTIGKLCATFGDQVLCGAGTVLSPEAVDQVAGVGGKLIVTPNTDPSVITHAVGLGLTVMPGFATPSEAFVAVKAGARALKLYPAGTYGPGHIKAVRDVLPKDIAVYAVGGVGAANLKPWIDAGVAGIGVGGELYRPGYTAQEVGQRAKALVAAWAEQTAQ
ncbi:2-dehydro-3-deoxy-6-phosphogalactonate aldolase [Caulobacter sp. BK020]|uniref:2-dehydro-3-deoxy-6-phosphogalactonate aldolase n=1 Tax=Caulobacter sp. BK020 TaxID=2512117 RepID=UPI0010EEA71A|nr:2-dehydro-3-deoxy-6-phosphogalactonate aldolase [Caulobacter sp. BK020]TCS13605.1 2-keto-3-deoxy-phosphogalactonate aldolase [Caulobacter sp. BK020]